MKTVAILLILVIIAASVMNMKASAAGEVIDLPSAASLNTDGEKIEDLNVEGARRRLHNRYLSRYHPIHNYASYQHQNQHISVQVHHGHHHHHHHRHH